MERRYKDWEMDRNVSISCINVVTFAFQSHNSSPSKTSLHFGDISAQSSCPAYFLLLLAAKMKVSYNVLAIACAMVAMVATTASARAVHDHPTYELQTVHQFANFTWLENIVSSKPRLYHPKLTLNRQSARTARSSPRTSPPAASSWSIQTTQRKPARPSSTNSPKVPLSRV
jgi:hypothetical protein